MAVETAAPESLPARAPRSGNTSGRARCLWLFTPVRPGIHQRFLEFTMKTARYHPYFKRHSMQFNFIYFVRWAIVHEFPGGGGGRPPLRQRYAYLLFESNFDVPWRQYIDAFAYVIPRDIRTIWGRGPAFPGPPPAEPLKDWIARNSLESGHFYAAYPHGSVKTVKSGLAVAERAAELEREAARLSPAQFRAAFERLVDDVQRHL